MNDLCFRLPRWSELPQLDLYMDQVLLVMNRALEPLAVKDLTVTATMINNYVKMKLTAPAEKKKYTAEHLARFFVICFFKQVLSMSQVAEVMEDLLSGGSFSQSYDCFCEELERCLSYPAHQEQPLCPPLTAWAIRAVACKLRVEKMLENSAK